MTVYKHWYKMYIHGRRKEIFSIVKLSLYHKHIRWCTIKCLSLTIWKRTYQQKSKKVTAISKQKGQRTRDIGQHKYWRKPYAYIKINRQYERQQNKDNNWFSFLIENILCWKYVFLNSDIYDSILSVLSYVTITRVRGQRQDQKHNCEISMLLMKTSFVSWANYFI